MESVDYLFRSKKQEPKKQEATSQEIRFSALQQLLLLRCRKVSQAGVPGEVNCGAAVLAALPLPDLPGPEVAKGNLRVARPAQVLGSTGCGRGAPAYLPPPVLSARVQLCLAPEGRL